ncbi:MAG: hypothetical protein ABIT82_08755 [Ramlibacter sp.]
MREQQAHRDGLWWLRQRLQAHHQAFELHGRDLTARRVDAPAYFEAQRIGQRLRPR